MEQTTLEDRLREIEARAAGAGHSAHEAAERIRNKLAAARAAEPDQELLYTIADPWTLRLFIALCRRYGLRPYRRYRQRRSTVQIMAPKSFVDETLWPEFMALGTELIAHLSEVTDRVIRDVLHEGATELEEEEPEPFDP